MANRLTGKIVLVTGAASGLGEAQARVFAREGAKVMLADISTAGADAAAKIRDEGGSADFVQLDVSKLESWKDAVSAAVQTFGGLTSLSNTAGIIHYAGVEEETMDGWNRIISVNQTGVLLGMQAALPELVKSGNGAIVNVSSLIALIAAPGSISYV
ncbi:2,5-dichloro-2,5-cyclohexadiene-1,4-diol dehydrogenase LinX (plasmid) [Sphingomonas sp. MM-1]|uniref:SDR family NAD(P)-dependent oxidoreductase n=1 Tax=Sphingomonas sp. MM-1 TaxID=745310 RepID=UPI0002C0F033|nr:SDR family NAD(P)-dependent oxidoreductase [Sphingomonas sp. MM-1]AGH51633.1 2,5-dichloro-2,5-cyclohexadiene-1,4-diol dehydrogenase LinX [Sphingomonas sp. MM-1]